MYVKDILCVISVGTFEILHRIFYLYIEKYNIFFLQCWKFKSSQT